MELVKAVQGRLVPDGDMAGIPFWPSPYQKKFLRAAFADGVRIANLSVGRGGGKTGLASAIAACALLREGLDPKGEILFVAASHPQARIAFGGVLGMLAPELEEDRARPVKDREWRVWDSPNHSRIENRRHGTAARVISSDPARAHGLRPWLVIADEPAQWTPAARSGRMFAALRTSLGKSTGARIVLIGTRPADPSHWWSKLLDGRTADESVVSHVYAAKPDANPLTKAAIRAANPGIDANPPLPLWETLLAEMYEAERDAGALASWRALRLNQGTRDIEGSELIGIETWRECEVSAGGPPRPAWGPLVWGVDLGGAAAMSAVCAYWPQVGEARVMAAFASEPDLRSREANDRVDDGAYCEMARRGELRLLGGRTADVSALLDEAWRAWGAPALVAADRYRIAELEDALNAAGLGAGVQVGIEARGMGWRDGAEDVREFRRACLDGQVKAPKSFLLRHAIGAACTLLAPDGEAEKLVKRSNTARDDAAVALVLAVSAGRRELRRVEGLAAASGAGEGMQGGGCEVVYAI